MTEMVSEICALLTWVSLMATILIYHWMDCKYGGDDDER